ncbi:hypothetical protein Golob_013678 [Gossypium lobatum]|uniref:Uncharacterized protein n=1 Tax=Gossypium lobatum TaxID=34289 RepID=A0A7J8LQK7_9ROSI|nr:hypothetical protein [Gossypium lobatum]
MGVVAAPFLRPRVDGPYTFSLVTRWNFRLSYVGLPKQLKDIQLLLDQRPEAKVRTTWRDGFIINSNPTRVIDVCTTSWCVFCGTSVPNILLPDDDIDADTNANISTNNNDSGLLSAISLCDTIHLSVGSVANTPASLFYPTRDRITAADWDLYIHFNL